MPRAQEARLRDALEDYVRAYRGDGMTRTGRLGVPDHVADAKALLDKVGGSQDVRAESPGMQAAHSASGGFENAEQAARDLIQ